MSPAASNRLGFQILTEHFAVCETWCDRHHELCHRNQHWVVLRYLLVFVANVAQILDRTTQTCRCCQLIDTNRLRSTRCATVTSSDQHLQIRAMRVVVYKRVRLVSSWTQNLNTVVNTYRGDLWNIV